MARSRSARHLSGRAVAVLAVALLLTTATFAAYTYVAPLLVKTSASHGLGVSVLLACYGVGAVLGNLAGGRAADRYGPRAVLLAATGTSVVALGTLPLTTRHPASAAAAIAIWGAAYWSTNAPISAWLVSFAPADPAFVLSLNGTCVYIGMAGGAAFGGVLLDLVGIRDIAPLAATFALAALLLLRRTHQTNRINPAHVPAHREHETQ